jgi:hypothetical protein
LRPDGQIQIREEGVGVDGTFDEDGWEWRSWITVFWVFSVL